MLHGVLRRQLREIGIDEARVPSSTEWTRLLDLVSRSYAEAGTDDAASHGAPGAEAADDTAEQRTAEALRQSEDRYRALFEGSPLAMLAFDPESLRIVAANAAAVALYGYEHSELLGLTLADLKQSEDMPDLVQRMANLGDDPRSTRFTGVRRHRTKDGRWIDASVVSQAIDLGGRLTMLAMVNDVTKPRQLEEQLAHAHKLEAVGRFAGGIAHDFNNILTAILSFTSLATDELGEGHPVAPILHEVADAGARGAALTRQLLMLSRRDRGRPQLIPLAPVVRKLSPLLQRLIGPDIQIVTRLEDDRACVEVDPSQLDQLLLNLAVNARDAMPRGGTLTLALADKRLDVESAAALRLSEGRYLVLTVSDTGVGMSAATVARIFDPFFTTKERGKGTGLGLSTAFGIVSQYGGAIRVDSAPGRGTRFDVYLPRRGEIETTETLLPATPAPAGGGSVLLVDDDDQVRAGLRRMLGQHGYRVVEAGSAQRALEILTTKGQPIDVVVADVVMPGMSGMQLASSVRRHFPDVKIVLMSGLPGPGGAAGEARRIDEFLPKPFRSPDLLAAIDRVLRTPSRRRRQA